MVVITAEPVGFVAAAIH